ncbi:MAG: WecB/TagA/CpsF family glycosyltransferase [Kiritimatiellales bacterium]|nr:WecB/TagA/CpsF family glycosyltransferase [Kiritimatiellota bacterium]MBL7012489.1 WecB/TagA/CpsF family glycosyltransferase [Kiritimatiellales bacterium]
MDKVELLGIPVDVIDRPALLQKIDELAASPGVSLVNNVNAHACNLAVSDPEFHKILCGSDVVFCDGFGVKLAARLLGKKLGERMTPPDWIDELFALCVRKRYCVYFLGDTHEVVRKFSETVHRKHPHLRIAGSHDGFFDLGSDATAALFNEIVRLRPDIILTGMGMPRQEKWAWMAKKRIGKGTIIATGALFRWYTGHEKRAPFWMTQIGLEWLARLLAAPRRHFKRYVFGLPVFFLRIMKQRIAPHSGDVEE